MTNMTRIFNLPPSAVFYTDREVEKKALSQILNTHKAVFIEGLPGSGRTSFLADFFRQTCFNDDCIIYFCVKENEGIIDFLTRIRAEKHMNLKYHDPDFEERVESCKFDFRENDFFDTLFKSYSGSRGKDCYIIIDDIDFLKNAKSEVLARAFLDEQHPGHLVFVTSRKPDIPDHSKFDYGELEIHGLDSIGAQHFLTSLFASRGKKLDQELIALLAGAVRGHPMALKLLAASILKNETDLEPGDIKNIKGEFKKRISDYSDYFINVIWNRFTDIEKNLLSLVSIFRKFVDLRKLVTLMEHRDSHEMESIKQSAQTLSANFVFEKEKGRVRLFPLISCLVKGLLKKEQLIAYHALAAKYYSLAYKKNKILFQLEKIFHLYSARQYDKACDLAVKAGPSIIKAGYFTDLIQWCESLVLARGIKNPELMFLNARCRRIMGGLDQAEQILNTLCNQDNECTEILQARVFHELSIIARIKGDYKNGLALGEQACSLFQDCSCPESEAIAQFNKAEIYKDLGEYDFAQRIFNRLINQFNKSGDTQHLGMTLNSLAVIYKNQGNYEKSESCFFRALQIEEDLDNPFGTAAVLSNLSNISVLKGDYSAADMYNERCMALRTSMNDVLGLSVCLNNRAVIKSRTGKYDSALKDLNESLKIKRDFNDLRGISYSLNDIAGIYRARGLYQKAIDTYKESEAIKRSLSDQRGLVITLTGLGNIYKDLCEFNKARDVLHEALETARRMHLQSEESSILHQLGSFEAGTGNMKKAREFFETALRLSEKLGNPGESSRTMGALAGILKLEGDYKGADYYYRESLLIAEKIKDQKGMAITYNQLGALSSAQGKNEKALEFFEKSLEIKKDINDRRGIIESLIPMAKCLMESNRDDQASGILIKALKIARDLKLIKSQIIISGFIAELDIKNSNFTKADEGLKYALSCCHELDFTEGYAFIYKTFGKLYQMQNDFEKSHFYISLAIEQYNLLNKLNDIKQLRENLELFDKRNLDCLLSEIDANTDTEKLKKLNIRLLDKYGEDLVVVFTDIVGFTLKTELLSEIDIMKLIRDHDQAAEKIIYKNKGRIVKKIGDSIMACFTDPDMAVKSSAEFVRFLAEYSKTRKDAHKIQVRIGMNSGLVIKKDTDVFGDVVNTAARLSHYGSPNEIIMTKKLAGLLKSNDFPLTDLGECRIRGKKDTVSLFACTAV